MARIQLLHPSVAEKIAAGEVVERPASVVKELIENSLDAQATEIAVYLEDGGKSLIEITDNGIGMDGDDLGLSLQRHATSKLRELSDLDTLQSLGFRGEALPSIAAVSELSILSRAHSSEHAYEIRSAQGPAQLATFGHFLGSPNGTRIQVRGLFSQIPARLKFLKSQGSEVANTREWMERLALTHSHVGFKLISDERVILSLRPQTEVERVRQILSDGNDYPILTATSDQSYQGFSLRLHWLQGMSLPQTKKLVQVVNHRALRDRFLQQALLSPFKQTLLPGLFPALAVFLEINPSEIDVNVHPTKTEIRFLDGRKIFHAVDSLAKSLIEKHGAPNYVASADPGFAPQTLGFQRPGYSSTFGQSSFPRHPETMEAPAPISEQTPVPSHPFVGAQFSGVLFNTYLIYDLGNEAVLIDQHAAHERIRFEKLKSRWEERSTLTSQQLLLPEAVQFPPENRLLLEGRLVLLTRLGFEVEVFGENSLLFRAIPSEWDSAHLGPRLKALTERMLSDEISENLLDESAFEKLASEACHSAIRAGDRIDLHVAQSILNDLFACVHPWNCPHGRPTVVRIPQARFEEWFHRKV